MMLFKKRQSHAVLFGGFWRGASGVRSNSERARLSSTSAALSALYVETMRPPRRANPVSPVLLTSALYLTVLGVASGFQRSFCFEKSFHRDFRASRLHGELRKGGKININSADFTGADRSRRVEEVRQTLDRIRRVKNRGALSDTDAAEEADEQESVAKLSSVEESKVSPERAKELRDKAEKYRAQVRRAKEADKAAKREAKSQAASSQEDRTRALLAEYRASLGCAVEEMHENYEAIETAMANYRRLTLRGEYAAAVQELEGVRQWMAFSSEEGCFLLLELAMAYETAGDRANAAELYNQLLKSVFPDVRSNARMLIGRLYAVETLGMGESGKEMAKIAQFTLNATALANAAALNTEGKAMDFVQPMQPDLSQKEPDAASDVAEATRILKEACERGIERPSISSVRRGPVGPKPEKQVQPEDALSAVWRFQIEAEKRWVNAEEDKVGASSVAAKAAADEEYVLGLDGEWSPRFRIRLGEAVPSMAISRLSKDGPDADPLVFDAGTGTLNGVISAGPFKVPSTGSYNVDTALGRNILRMELPSKMLVPGYSVRVRVLHVSKESGVLVLSSGGEVEVWYREKLGMEGDLERLKLSWDQTEVQRWLYAWATESLPSVGNARASVSLTSKVRVEEARDGIVILFEPSPAAYGVAANRDGEVEADSYPTEDSDPDSDSDLDPAEERARGLKKASLEGGLRVTYDGSQVRICRSNYGPQTVVKEMSEKAILSALRSALPERFCCA
eukprot:scaffold149_cov315-Pinguiococcus_pyrenoidosus.AAC.10